MQAEFSEREQMSAVVRQLISETDDFFAGQQQQLKSSYNELNYRIDLLRQKAQLVLTAAATAAIDSGGGSRGAGSVIDDFLTSSPNHALGLDGAAPHVSATPRRQSLGFSGARQALARDLTSSLNGSDFHLLSDSLQAAVPATPPHLAPSAFSAAAPVAGSAGGGRTVQDSVMSDDLWGTALSAPPPVGNAGTIGSNGGDSLMASPQSMGKRPLESVLPCFSTGVTGDGNVAFNFDALYKQLTSDGRDGSTSPQSADDDEVTCDIRRDFATETSRAGNAARSGVARGLNLFDDTTSNSHNNTSNGGAGGGCGGAGRPGLKGSTPFRDHHVSSNHNTNNSSSVGGGGGGSGHRANDVIPVEGLPSVHGQHMTTTVRATYNKGRPFVVPIAGAASGGDDPVALGIDPTRGCQVLVEFKRKRVLQYDSTVYVHPGSYVIVGGDRGEDLGLVIYTWCEATSQGSANGAAAGAGAGAGAAASGDGSKSAKERAGLVSPLRDPNAGHTVVGVGLAGASLTRSIGVGSGVVLRLATDVEVVQSHGVQADLEERAIDVCAQQVLDHGLPMVIVDAEYQFDSKKLTFFYEAQQRMDFRELVRDLYKTFRARIWMELVDN